MKRKKLTVSEINKMSDFLSCNHDEKIDMLTEHNVIRQRITRLNIDIRRTERGIIDFAIVRENSEVSILTDHLLDLRTQLHEISRDIIVLREMLQDAA